MCVESILPHSDICFNTKSVYCVFISPHHAIDNFAKKGLFRTQYCRGAHCASVVLQASAMETDGQWPPLRKPPDTLTVNRKTIDNSAQKNAPRLGCVDGYIGLHYMLYLLFSLFAIMRISAPRQLVH